MATDPIPPSDTPPPGKPWVYPALLMTFVAIMTGGVLFAISSIYRDHQTQETLQKASGNSNVPWIIDDVSPAKNAPPLVPAAPATPAAPDASPEA